jgi:hypothetical protein
VEARRQGRRPRYFRHASGPASSSVHGTTSSGRARRSRSRSRARRTQPASRYVDAQGDFENIGPDGVRPSPIQSRSGPPRADAPPPLIDYASRNEAQGRQSAARAAEEEELRRLARTAHHDRREQDEQEGVNRRGNARAAIAQGMRRGLSDGMLAALATMPTRPDARPSAPQQSFRERTAHLPFTFNPVTGEVDSDSDREWDQESSAIHGDTRPLQHAPTIASFEAGSSEQNEALRGPLPRAASPALSRPESAAPGWSSPTHTLVDDPLPVYSNGLRASLPAPPYEASQEIYRSSHDEPVQAPFTQTSEHTQQAGPSPPQGAPVSPASARPGMRRRRRTGSFRESRPSRSPPTTPRYNVGRSSTSLPRDTPEETSSPGLVSPASSGYPQTPRTPAGVGDIPFHLTGRRTSDSPAQGHPSQPRTASSPILVRKISRPLLMTQNTGASSGSLNPFLSSSSFLRSTPTSAARELQNPWQEGREGSEASSEYFPPLGELSMNESQPVGGAEDSPSTPMGGRRRRGLLYGLSDRLVS